MTSLKKTLRMDSGARIAVTRLSVRDSERLVELLDAAFTPSAELKQAAASFKEWERTRPRYAIPGDSSHPQVQNDNVL